MNAREIALQIINDVHHNQAYANVSLARALKKHAVSEQDRRFITELVYGTVKTDGTLAWMIGRYVSRPIEKIAPMMQDILKLGFYQIFFMSKVPPSAACNQSVELAKKYGHVGTVKFINAVLRSAIRNPEKVDFSGLDESSPRYLALKYYHPEWLIARWLKQFGRETTLRICDFNNQSAALSIRTNTLKTDREKLLEILAAEHAVCARSNWAPEGIVCTEHQGMHSFASLQAGLFQVQDESSMLVAHVLRPEPGEFIIDCCSAPGGKTTHIATLMQNRGRILATDIYAHKLEKVEENAERLGIEIIETKLADALQIGEMYPSMADRVLVDAPCSGLGVLRRKPDARWRKDQASLQALPELQLQILKSAANAVKPGGVLVYSTCTIAREENELVVEAFLRETPSFHLERTSDFLPVPSGKNGETVQLLPQDDGVDGFFIARMKRKEQVQT